jgi:hypothetical protein
LASKFTRVLMELWNKLKFLNSQSCIWKMNFRGCFNELKHVFEELKAKNVGWHASFKNWTKWFLGTYWMQTQIEWGIMVLTTTSNT